MLPVSFPDRDEISQRTACFSRAIISVATVT